MESPPFPPGEDDPLEWAVQHVGVLYPPLRMMDSGGHFTLAAMQPMPLLKPKTHLFIHQI